MSKYTAGSLFAGIGGVCLGFEKAGFNVKWANEIDKHACKTYRSNFPNNNLYEKDIHDIKNPKELGYVDVITSGFPCQAFSIAGYQKGFKDERGNLFFETARFIDEIKPKAFLLENVKNLKSHDQGRTIQVIEDVITRDLGYSYIPFILNSKDYGNIPQTRERIYIVGFKNEAKEDNFRTKSFTIPNRIPLKKSIHDILSKEKQEKKFYYNEDFKHYDKLINEMISPDTLYQWRRQYVRENKSNLCPTLTANMGTGGHNVPLIRDKYGIRKLTPKETVRFQGFDDNFSFPDDMANSHCYKQAGNSVVVPVIERIASEIKRVLDISSSDKIRANHLEQQKLEF